MRSPNRFQMAARKWELGPIAVTLLSFLLACGLIWQLELLVTSTQRVDHSDRVIAQAHELEKVVVDLETGLRGYVITGSGAFLEPYTVGRARVDADLSALEAMSRGQPLQEARIAQLRDRLQRWIDHSEQVIAVERSGEDARVLISSGRGKRLVDAMRSLLGDIVQTETHLRDERSAISMRRAAITEMVAGGTLLLLGGFLVLSLLQRRRWQSALEASEERFHALTDQISEYAVYLLDPNGEVASWNAGARRLKGYSEAEIVGKDVSVLFTPEDVRSGMPKRALAEAAEKGQCVAQCWHVRKDGSRFWADAVLTALHDDQGRLTGFSMVTRDLTQRKWAEERILAAEAKLRVVLENAYDGILIANGRGEIEFANRSARNALGYSMSELEGQRLGFVLAEQERERQGVVEALGAERMRDSNGVELEVQARRKDGHELPIAMTLSRTSGPFGEGALVTVIFRDISEARRRSAQLWLLAELGHELSKSFECQTVFRTVAERVVPALADWAAVDLQQGKGKVSRLVVVHGDPRKKELAQRFQERALRGPVENARILEVIATGQSALIDERVLERPRGAVDEESDQMLRQLGFRSCVVVPLRARGRILGALTLVAADRCFTAEDLRFAEEIALRASLLADNARLFQKATEEARLREDLMAIVSHDLRNPIHAIRLNAQVLEKVVSQMAGEGAPGRDKLRLLASSIERAVDQGNRLITDLLDSAKLESGTFTVARAPTRVRDLVADALETLQPIAAEKGVSVETHLTSDVVSCDHERIVQVISNLIGNAIKFTPRGGRIAVHVERREGEVRVGIQDNGHGIPPELLPHVFERYWQGQEARRGGAGLGLSIAKGIVEAHGGHLWAESEPNVGSIFWFALPLVEGTHAEPAVQEGEGQRSTVQDVG